MTTRADVIHAAREYLGVPYKHQGRNRHGLDCIGLVIAVGHDLGLSDFDIDGYGRVPSGRRMARQIAEVCQRIQAQAARNGDMIHLSFTTQPQHLALLTDVGMIHADNTYGVVEHVLDAKWRARIRGWYQLPGVTD